MDQTFYMFWSVNCLKFKTISWLLLMRLLGAAHVCGTTRLNWKAEKLRSQSPSQESKHAPPKQWKRSFPKYSDKCRCLKRWIMHMQSSWVMNERCAIHIFPGAMSPPLLEHWCCLWACELDSRSSHIKMTCGHCMHCISGISGLNLGLLATSGPLGVSRAMPPCHLMQHSFHHRVTAQWTQPQHTTRAHNSSTQEHA